MEQRASEPGRTPLPAQYESPALALELSLGRGEERKHWTAMSMVVYSATWTVATTMTVKQKA